MKKINKFHFLLSLCLIFIMGCSFLCVGCNGCNGSENSSNGSETPPVEEPAPITITLNESTLQMIVGDTRKLTVNYSKLDSALTLEWYSDNENIASVKKGLIEAISEGTTTIRAKYGTAEAVCQVQVSFDNQLPRIKLGTVDDFCINKSTIYTFSPSIVYRDKEFTDGKFRYTSSDINVVKMENNVLTAVDNGTAQIYIEGSWRGKTIENSPALQAVINVEVVDDVDIYLKGKEQASNDIIQLYTLESFDGNSYDITSSFEPVIYKNGEVFVTEYRINNARPDIVEFNSEEKCINALAHGEAVITIEAVIDEKVHSKTFTIRVLRPEKTVENAIQYFSTYTGTLKTVDGFKEQTVIEHIVGDSDKEIIDAYQNGTKLNVQNNRIFGVENSRDSAYETILTVGTTTEIYHVPATVYGMYITEAEDLSVFVLNSQKKVVDCYVELGQDVYAQHYTLPKGDFQLTYKKESEGFKGTLDGKGYTIKGLKLQTNQGLFGSITSATIKNIAFENWSYIDGYSQSSGILGVCLDNLRMNNVYIKIDKLPQSTQGAALLSSYKISGGTFKCVYIEYTENIGEVSYNNCYSAFGAIMPTNIPTFENCLVVSQAPIGICKTENSNLQVAVASNISSATMSALVTNIKQGYAQANNVDESTVQVANNSLNGVLSYNTVLDFQQDYVNTASLLNSFSSKYWTVSEYKLLWGENNSQAVDYGTIRLDLGLASGNQIQGLQTIELHATAGDTVQLPTNLTCMGFIFKGWSYLGVIIENGRIDNYDGMPMTVQAVWEKDPNYIQTPDI